MPPLPENDRVWTVRAHAVGPDEVRAYSGRHVFSVGAQAALQPSDLHPSAVEYLLGALAGDLLRGFRLEAARRSVVVRATELSLAGRLNNVLVHLGVRGEDGHAGLESVTGTLYASMDGDAPTRDAAWQETLTRSPLFQTLSRCATVSIELRVSDEI
jgi:hypothetical protein